MCSLNLYLSNILSRSWVMSSGGFQLTLLVYYYCSIYRCVFVNVSADDAYTRPDVVAIAVLKAVTSKNPTMRYIAGKEANAQL